MKIKSESMTGKASPVSMPTRCRASIAWPCRTRQSIRGHRKNESNDLIPKVLNALLVLIFAGFLCPVMVLGAGPAEGAEKDTVSWQAHYIFTHQWGEDKPVYEPTNLFIVFRKSFDLTTEIQEAQAYIFADPRYQLFVNGRKVGRGPVHSEAFFFFYDYYDLKPYLNRGRNTVAVLMNTLGDEGLGWYMLPPWTPIRGALIFQADLKLTNGQNLRIISDPSWKFHRHEAWEQNTPRVNPDTPHMELYDARLEAPNWQTSDFDDTAWPNAVVLKSRSRSGLTKPPMEPYFRLLRRSIPYMTEEEIWPEKVPGIGETDSTVTPMEELAERTTKETHYALENFVVTNERALTAKEGYITIERKSLGTMNPRAPYITVDYGRQVAGYLQLEVDAPAGTMIDIAFGEEVLEEGNVNATSPGGKYVSRYIAREGLQRWERYEWYGFQFVQFTFRNFARPVRFRTSLNFSAFPMGKGSFSCSDPRLNQIWETARYTMRLATWTHFLDVLQREQRQYQGDGQLEVLAHLAVNGDLSIVKKLLKDGSRTQRPDGLLRMTTGARWPATDIIPDYNFSWIDTLAVYYMFTGDIDLIREIYPSLVKCLDWFSRYTGADGMLAELPYWVFLDFSGPDKRGKSSILNARYHYSLNQAASLAKLVGDQHHAESWSQAAGKIKRSFDSYFWDEGRGLYVDAWDDGKKSPYLGQLANGMAILSGLASEDKIEKILRVISDLRSLRVSTPRGSPYLYAVDPPPRPPDFDITKDVVMAQPHGFHFVMMALAKIGRYDLQISQVKERWGAWLDQGATAFWGNWDRTNTLAAGWASPPAYYIATTVLGIRPVEPGFRVFAVEPRTVGLDWAKGSFPSVRGEIPVSWTTSSGNFRLEGEIPEGTSAEVLLPRTERAKPREIRLDGRSIWKSGTGKTVSGIKWIREEDGGVRVYLTKPGKYELTAVY